MAVVCRLVKQPYALDALLPDFQVRDGAPPVTVGRTAENTLHAEDKTISKQHCSLELHFTRSPSQNNALKKHLFVKDNATFGTYVNEHKLGKGAPLCLVPQHGMVAFRRPKSQDDGHYSGDYCVFYEPGNVPVGDELLCDSSGNVLPVVPIVDVNNANQINENSNHVPKYATQTMIQNLQAFGIAYPPPPTPFAGGPAAGGLQGGAAEGGAGAAAPGAAAGQVAGGQGQQAAAGSAAAAPTAATVGGSATMAPYSNLMPASGEAGMPSPILIPASMAGLIVGKRGETINRICNETGAKLDIAKDQNQNLVGDQKQVSVLDGTPEQVAHAKKIIDDMVRTEMANRAGNSADGNNNNSGSYHDNKGGYYGKGGKHSYKGSGHDKYGYGGKDWYGGKDHGKYGNKEWRPKGGENKWGDKVLTPREGSEIIITAAETIGMLIGRQGETIARVKQESGCEIEIGLLDGQEDPVASRAVQITGEPANVARAKQTVEEILVEAANRMAKGKGKKGKKDHKGSYDSNPNYQPLAPQGSHEYPPPQGSPQGTPPQGSPVAAVDPATGQPLQGAVAAAPQHPGSAPNGVVLAPPPEQQQQVQQLIRHEREVPTDVVGLVIGSKGETIRRLQAESGCRIEVDKARGKPGVSQIVVFEASDMSYIERGIAAMDEVLRPVVEQKRKEQQMNEQNQQQSSAMDRTAAAIMQEQHAIFQQEEDGMFVCHFPINEQQMHLIIGEDSVTIRKLGEDSGAELSIVRVGTDTDEYTCIIKGNTHESVERGKSLVEQLLNQHLPQPASSPQQDQQQPNQMNDKNNNNFGKGPPGGGNNNYQSHYDKDSGGHKGKGKYDRFDRKGGKNYNKDHDNYGGGKNRRQNEEKRKLYIDEMPFPRKQVLEIHPQEMEVFVSGMRTDIAEGDLWKCLCAIGASDVAEILLLKDPDRGDVSKGMAYVLFTNQQHALAAVQKLSERPLHVGVDEIATDQLQCTMSESERVLRGKEGTYKDELIGKLMGKKAVRMQEIQSKVGCNRAILTGRGMKGFGTTDNCTRLHLVLCCDPGTTIDAVEAAKPIWLEQLTYAFQDPRDDPRNQPYSHQPPPSGVFIPPGAPGGPPLQPGQQPPGSMQPPHGGPPPVQQQHPHGQPMQQQHGGPPQVLAPPGHQGGPPPAHMGAGPPGGPQQPPGAGGPPPPPHGQLIQPPPGHHPPHPHQLPPGAQIIQGHPPPPGSHPTPPGGPHSTIIHGGPPPPHILGGPPPQYEQYGAGAAVVPPPGSAGAPHNVHYGQQPPIGAPPGVQQQQPQGGAVMLDEKFKIPLLIKRIDTEFPVEVEIPGNHDEEEEEDENENSSGENDVDMNNANPDEAKTEKPKKRKKRTAQYETKIVTKKYCEAVALVGSELRWQQWCDTIGGENWKAYPLRWGKEGQLFVILQHRTTGAIKLCVVEEKLPCEQWKTVVAPPVELFSAVDCHFKPFNIDGKSYLACLDRPNKKLIMYKIRDPNEAWETCYQALLQDEGNEDSMDFSQHAKIHIFYCPATRKPYAIVHDRVQAVPDAASTNPAASRANAKSSQKFYNAAELYEIHSAREKWKRVDRSQFGSANGLPLPQTKFRIWPVYMRTNNPNPAAYATKNGAIPMELSIEVFLFCMDIEQKELRIIYIPREGAADNEWHIVARKSFAADTRLSMLYIAGKPEPMCMSLSSASNQACLFKVHLHLVIPPIGRSAKDVPIAHRPILEELFRRNTGELLMGHPAYNPQQPNKYRHQLIPVDTSADLACSQAHPWISQPIKESALPRIPTASTAPPGSTSPTKAGLTLTRGPFGDSKDAASSASESDDEKERSKDKNDGSDAEGGDDKERGDDDVDMDKKGANDEEAAAPGTTERKKSSAVGQQDTDSLPFEVSPFEDDQGEKGPFGAVKRENPFDDGKYHIGDLVEGNFKRQGKWYVAKITGISSNGNYHLDYEGDSWTESDIWPQNIRPLSLKNATFNSWRGPKDVMMIRNDLVGLIIGTKGSTIKELERDMGVKIFIKDSLDKDGNYNAKSSYNSGGFKGGRKGKGKDADPDNPNNMPIGGGSGDKDTSEKETDPDNIKEKKPDEKEVQLIAEDAESCRHCRDRILSIVGSAEEKHAEERKRREELEAKRREEAEEYERRKKRSRERRNANYDSYQGQHSYEKDSYKDREQHQDRAGSNYPEAKRRRQNASSPGDHENNETTRGRREERHRDHREGEKTGDRDRDRERQRTTGGESERAGRGRRGGGR
ncbi:unnamed protein product [Amoebophrya sp. A120]|nr:unnamed protein product [Amoebophrya sp. A120]|eukprot:GSA120T00008611001.1